MRDIIYRGKRNDNSEWVEGHGYLIDNAMTDDNIYIWSDKKFKWYKVDRGTLGEYTGLLDKNGVKIFEGDIVREDEYDFATEVVFGNFCILKDSWGITHHTQGFFCKFDDDSGYRGLNSGIVVIGNIHDNPELFTEAK